MKTKKEHKRCHYCGVLLTFEKTRKHVAPVSNLGTWDHIKPLILGGSDSPGNKVVACYKCNVEKGRLMVDEWRAVLHYRRMKPVKTQPIRLSDCLLPTSCTNGLIHATMILLIGFVLVAIPRVTKFIL